MSITSEQFITALRTVVTTPVVLHQPYFGGHEWEYVKECLDTGWVSSVGKFVDRFEESLAGFVGARRGIAIANGTSALHLCLELAGVMEGDEVVVPTLTFVATANAVAYCGAVPHFADSAENTFGLCVAKLADHFKASLEMRADGCAWNRETGRRVRACVAVHIFGHPVDMDPLAELCTRYNVTLIEDCAESLGSYYKGRHTGNVGVLASFSFNGNKIATTGGGGAIITNDEVLAHAAKHLSTTAKVPHKWAMTHDQIGYNYRMPNINAALGCAQLEQMSAFVESKRRLAARYQKAFAGLDGLSFFAESSFAKSNYWLNAVALDEAAAPMRDALLDAANDAGIMTRPVWTLMHTLPMYAGCPRAQLDTAESLSRRVINIPSSQGLLMEEHHA